MSDAGAGRITAAQRAMLERSIANEANPLWRSPFIERFGDEARTMDALIKRGLLKQVINDHTVGMHRRAIYGSEITPAGRHALTEVRK